jgi:hypothetical protein
MNQQTEGPTGGRPPTEEELRAQLEAELKRLRVDDVLAQSVVSLLNLGARRAGLAGADTGEVDPGQVESAIEAVQALLPILDRGRDPSTTRDLRDALAQLQLAYARLRGAAPPASGEAAAQETGKAPAQETGKAPAQDAGTPPPEQAQADRPAQDPGPAESSGRLWVPGR